MTSLTRATAVMTVGTILSRMTGVAKLAVITATIGVAESRLPDTYNLANTAPNIIYELVLGGILTSVFVPVIVELFEKESRERAWEVTSALINVSLVVLTAVALIGIAAAPLLAKIYSFRLQGAEAARQQEVMTFLLRIFVPQIIFYGLAAITAGLLNAHKRFAAPMYTPILNNLAVIAVFGAFYEAFGGVTLAEVTTEQLWIIGAGTTGGIILMALAQLPSLRDIARYRATLSAAHPSLRKLGRLSIFVIGYVVANQIGYLVVQILANAEQGAYSAYIAAYTFFIFPHSLFSVSITTALLPGMSAHATNERWPEFIERVSTGIRATFLLVLPAAVGLLILGEPVIRLLLEHGIMKGTSTELVSGVLRFFVIGLVPFSLFQLFSRVFYAMQDTKTPFLINCAAVALNTAVNVPMFAWLGVEGLAAGHASAYVFASAVSARVLARRVGGLDGRRVIVAAARICLAAAGMAVVVAGALAATRGVIAAGGLLPELAVVLVPAAAGGASFLAFAHLARVEEMGLLRNLVGGVTPKPRPPAAGGP